MQCVTKEGLPDTTQLSITTSMICGMYCCTQTAVVDCIYKHSQLHSPGVKMHSLENLLDGRIQCHVQRVSLDQGLQSEVSGGSHCGDHQNNECSTKYVVLTVALVKGKKIKQEKQLKSLALLC